MQGIKATYSRCGHEKPESIPADYPYLYPCPICGNLTSVKEDNEPEDLEHCWSCNALNPVDAFDCGNCGAGL